MVLNIRSLSCYCCGAVPVVWGADFGGNIMAASNSGPTPRVVPFAAYCGSSQSGSFPRFGVGLVFGAAVCSARA